MNERLTDEQLLDLLRQVDIQAMRIPSGVRRLADLICEKILSEAMPEPDTTSEAGYTPQALRDYGAYLEDEGYKRGMAKEGWKEATIAWEVCASIHREYAKKKDPFFTTRQEDFIKHAEAARKHTPAPAPDHFRDAAKMVADTEDNGFDLLHDRPHAEMPGRRGAKSLKVRAPAEVPSVDQLWDNDEVMALNAELGLTMDQLSRLASAITRITHPAAPPADWRERFSQAVYDDLAAADNQDVPLEEYPARILKVLDAVIGREMNPAPAEVPMPKPVAYGFGNTAITGHTNRLMMVRIDIPGGDQYAGAFWLPLVLADEARTYGAACRAAGEAAGYARGLAEAGQDAERYRWLRGDGCSNSERWTRWEIQRWNGVWNPIQGVEMDAYVDAALRVGGEVMKSEQIKRRFMDELQHLLVKWGAELTAKDHWGGYPECGEDVRMTVTVPAIYDADHNCLREFTEIDLGHYVAAIPREEVKP